MSRCREQRWHRKHQAWTTPRQLFDHTRAEVTPIPEQLARSFILTHHYATSYPAARARYGLWQRKHRHAPAQLVGVAVFSQPMQSRCAGAYFEGATQRQVVELGRFCLLDSAEFNAESWFLGRAFAQLRKDKPEVVGVLSYSDPVPRQLPSGGTIQPGHIGTIYQAHNGRHVGRSSPRTLIRTRGWHVVSSRTLSKLRQDDRGAAGAYEQLRRLGAPRRNPGESGAAYVTRALASSTFIRTRHPGNLAYTWALRRSARNRQRLALPYPTAAQLAA